MEVLRSSVRGTGVDDGLDVGHYDQDMLLGPLLGINKSPEIARKRTLLCN